MDWATLRQRAISQTKRSLAAAVTDDSLITQTISAIEELDKAANLLVKRLREWHGLCGPEMTRAIKDNEAFVKQLLTTNRNEQLRELGIKESMGKDLPPQDVDALRGLASAAHELYHRRSALEAYLESLMRRHCPNMTAITGPTIGARLLREAGSLRKLASIQASTIQLYGAEKALFRHLKTGAKPPKYGHLINHPLVAQADAGMRGKVARALADKISIACKVDHFKGEPVGESLRALLEQRFGGRV